MARLSGKDGSVVVGTVTITGIKSWVLDKTNDILETTGFDSGGWKTFGLGVDHWSGSFEGYKDGAPLATSTTATASITLKESTTTGQSWTGTAIITAIHPKVSHDGLVTYAYDFQGTGTLTVATT